MNRYVTSRPGAIVVPKRTLMNQLVTIFLFDIDGIFYIEAYCALITSTVNTQNRVPAAKE
jgi:hypothetical protein